MVFKSEKEKNVKYEKQRVTLLLGANTSGAEKLPLFAITIPESPQCFRNLKSLTVTYFVPIQRPI